MGMIITRRTALAGALATLLPLRAAAQALIPQRASARVIIDNDFAGDPDGLVALAHQLLTPKTRTTLITASLLDRHFSGGLTTSAAAGRAAALELIAQGGFAAVPVIAGAEATGADPAGNAAARAIVAEAMRDDPLPLFITCGGPLTNIAAALQLEPRLATRATLVWIGGGRWPQGGWEYNANCDLNAARAVIEHSAIPLWQVPQNAYRQMAESIADMTVRLRTASPLGRWLYDRFTHPPAFIDVAGSWPLGDSPLVLLTALSRESSLSVDRIARAIGDDGRYGTEIPGRMVRVYETLDARLTFDDFFALLALHAAGAH